MTSIPLRFNEMQDAMERDNFDLFTFKHWLALRSCTEYDNGTGFITSFIRPAKVNFMFSKNIKLLIYYHRQIYLVTENGEEYFWLGEYLRVEYGITNNSNNVIHYYPHIFDWSNRRIVKTTNNTFNFLALTDDGKIYYQSICDDQIIRGIQQMIIEERVTCFGCGCGFYILITDNNKTYSWGINVNGELGISISTTDYSKHLSEVIELSGKTIVKVACGDSHTLVLTDKGEVYAWGINNYRQSNFDSEINKVLSPIMVNIPNVSKLSDVAVLENSSLIKSSKDGLVYIWGCLIGLPIKKPTVCEYTNIFDICNSVMGQSPVSMDRVYTDEETSILNDLKAAFDDHSTSDLTIQIMDQSIYVHKAILKIRSSYFRSMFRFNSVANSKTVIEYCDYSYIIYRTFLKYLYFGIIDSLSIEDLLDLLILADVYCEENLEKDCTQMIKEKITVSNIFLVVTVAIQYNKTELEEYCFMFFMKNKTNVMNQRSFEELNFDTKELFLTRANNLFSWYSFDF